MTRARYAAMSLFLLVGGGAAPAMAEGEMAKDFDFSFSPKGNLVAYYSYKGDKLPDIVTRAGHGPETNLTNREGTWDIEPDFSPDGKSIVYSSGDSMASLTLRIMNADGSNDRLFYDGPANEVGANWSPDGSKIVFSSFDSNLKTNVIHLVDSDGSNVRTLTADMPGQSSGASWSPGGEWILFSNRPSEDGQRDIYRMRADGSDRVRLTHDAISQTAPIYSPDGEWIVFIGGQGHEPADVYAMPADSDSHGTPAVRLTDTKSEFEYFVTYTPDGAHLVFSRGDWDTGFKMAHMPAPTGPGR